jgi:hypothetical protein
MDFFTGIPTRYTSKKGRLIYAYEFTWRNGKWYCFQGKKKTDSMD